ncbi:MAG TPA: urea ABC transporter substrate-binding protein [Rhodospirillaceae bacterium]|nr:urea ABC transporter substrate-binding protein [Rhodospirillaceae bacterium]|tara:strand:- start:4674 stop:5954 length:1281 start_codon:yes stop_codon:yes gene_type:complete
MKVKLRLFAAIGGILAFGFGAFAQADETIKIGVLHSLSGTMAVSETPLKDTVLMLVEEQNKKGGLLGRKIEAVVLDPASDWPKFAAQARELLEKHKVAAIFGCWTSASRKSVLPVVEELNGLLFYPVQYEGQESSRNIFYLGSAPNQQAIPAVDYLMSKDGAGAERFVLLGTDYVYPRTSNRILRFYLNSRGISNADIMEHYTPFGHSDWAGILADIKKFATSGKKTAIVSTINGDANFPFYKELAKQGFNASEIPVMAFSVNEVELARLDAPSLVGHMAAWNYFMSVENPRNAAFIKKWRSFTKDESRVTSAPMAATNVAFNMWVQAVEQAGTTNVNAVRQAMYGQKFKNLSGGTAVMNANHHLSKPVLIGAIQADGQFKVVWQTEGEVAGDAWSDFLPESAPLTANWTYPWVCGKCAAPRFKAD